MTNPIRHFINLVESAMDGGRPKMIHETDEEDDARLDAALALIMSQGRQQVGQLNTHVNTDTDHQYDKDDIEAAFDAHRAVANWLLRVDGTKNDTSRPLPSNVFHWNQSELAVKATDIGVQAPALTFIFTRVDGRTPHFRPVSDRGTPVIVLPILREAGNLNGAYDAFVNDFYKSVFIHEFAHCREFSRRGMDMLADYPGTHDRSPEAYTRYYNSSQEINAYTVQALAEKVAWFRDALERDDVDLDLVANLAFASDEEYFKSLKEYYLDKEFYRFLTPENRSRVKQRMIRYVQDHLRPWLRERFIDMGLADRIP